MNEQDIKKYCRTPQYLPDNLNVTNEVVNLCKEYAGDIYFNMKGEIIAVHFHIVEQKVQDIIINRFKDTAIVLTVDENNVYSHLFCIYENCYNHEDQNNRLKYILDIRQDTSGSVYPMIEFINYHIFDSILQWCQNPFTITQKDVFNNNYPVEYKNFIIKPNCKQLYITEKYQYLFKNKAIIDTSDDILVRRYWAGELAKADDHLDIENLFSMTKIMLGEIYTIFISKYLSDKEKKIDINYLEENEKKELLLFIQG